MPTCAGGKSDEEQGMMEKKKVLLVDDDPHILNLISRWLAEEGLPCDTAKSAKDALALLNTASYDLVVSDLCMAEKSGLVLLDETRAISDEIAFIMVTGMATRETAISALKKGAYSYLLKPLNHEEFLLHSFSAFERQKRFKENKYVQSRLEQQVREKTKHIRTREAQIAHRLISASGYRDEETGEHIKRIGLCCARFAQILGASEDEVEDINLAGSMHDVGKIGIPDTILFKQGKLSEEEFEAIKEHCAIGAKILAGTDIPVLKLAHDIALYHHEKWDGTGYPCQLHKDEIPLPARMTAIVDVYDALSNDRVYRRAFPEPQVVRIMHEMAGHHFDPELFRIFAQNLPSFREILFSTPDSPYSGHEA